MIPMEFLPREEKHCDDGEDGKGYNLLDHLELNQGEGTTVVDKPHSVGGDLETIFQEGDAPGEENDADKGPAGSDTGIVEPQMTIPSERHEDV